MKSLLIDLSALSLQKRSIERNIFFRDASFKDYCYQASGINLHNWFISSHDVIVLTFVPLIFQEICSKNERYSSQTHRFRFSHFRVGTPQFSRIDKALQSSWSHFGTWMVPSMWCLEHRLYYFWASSSKFIHFLLF